MGKYSRRKVLLAMIPAAWILAVPGAIAGEPTPAGSDSLVYTGTYTGGKSKGIYLFRLDSKSGALAPLGLAAELASPSFLAIHGNRKFLYAVSELGSFEGKPGGAVTAFSIGSRTGKLSFLNQKPSGGAAPCHLAVTSSGKHLIVANYSGGTVSVFPLGDDGKLGDATAVVRHRGSSVNRRRQEGPHPHGVYLDPSGSLVLIPDLGLDQVILYRLDESKGVLAPSDPPSFSLKPGSGPRHLAFHPDGKRLYVINELSSTVTAFSCDGERGKFQEIQTISTLPDSFRGESTTAEIAVHPSGKYLYGSNRGHDSIAIFSIDAATGKLALLGHESTRGKTPRNFAIDPTGRILLAANQGSDSIAVFKIEARTGKLDPEGRPVEAFAPVCVAFLTLP